MFKYSHELSELPCLCLILLIKKNGNILLSSLSVPSVFYFPTHTSALILVSWLWYYNTMLMLTLSVLLHYCSTGQNDISKQKRFLASPSPVNSKYPKKTLSSHPASAARDRCPEDNSNGQRHKKFFLRRNVNFFFIKVHFTHAVKVKVYELHMT